MLVTPIQVSIRDAAGVAHMWWVTLRGEPRGFLVRGRMAGALIEIQRLIDARSILASAPRPLSILKLEIRGAWSADNKERFALEPKDWRGIWP